VLEAGDRLLVECNPETLHDLAGRGYLTLEAENVAADQLVSADIEVAEVGLTPGTDLEGRTLREAGFRQRFGVIVLAVKREGRAHRTHIDDTPLGLSDVLLVVGGRRKIDALRSDPDFIGAGLEFARTYHLEERLMRVRVPDGSALVGKTLVESRLGDRFGLGVMGIVRDGVTRLVPAPHERILAADVLLMKGRPEDLEAVEGLHRLEVDTEAEASTDELETEEVALAEAVLSPRSTSAGRTLRGLHFREKYGLSVVAVSREGRTIRTDLGRLPLRFGDALLLHGPRDKLRVLGSEPDFIVLQADVQPPALVARAPIAATVMAGVVLAVVLGWLPIYIAAVAGAVAMVLTRCLSMEEAYRYIEWRAVFLIAGMIPLGIAMQDTGAARLFTEAVVSAVSGYGPMAVMAALFLVTALGAQVMPTSAVAILMAPIAYRTAGELGISPHALMMTVAMSASASFLSPVAHPANILIMGPGGYRFGDYIRVGLPLTLVCLAVVLLVLPFFWPL
jgi:di/tricarboxylate transporter